TIRLWETSSKKLVGEPLQGHTTWVNSISFSPDGTRIVSGSSDKTVQLWDGTTGQLVGNPSMGTLVGLGQSRSRRMGPILCLARDGWMIGPNRRLLFWVPPTFRHAFYTPQTAMVMPRGYTELDLSRMAHGQRWENCQTG
ncbi:hypothetical protein BDR07DRAFT_1286817, partial [Suillus spraguei]